MQNISFSFIVMNNYLLSLGFKKQKTAVLLELFQIVRTLVLDNWRMVMKSIFCSKCSGYNIYV